MKTIAIVILALAAVSTAEVKIRFQQNQGRTVSDVADVATLRHSFEAPRDSLCQTVGASAGALIAHRLSIFGSVSDGRRLPRHSLLNLRTLIYLLSLRLAQELQVRAVCSQIILKVASIGMCQKIMCGMKEDGDELGHNQSLTIALSTYGVLGAVPSLVPIRAKLGQPIRNCQKMLYNLRLDNSVDFHKNPQYYVNRILYGLSDEVLGIRQILMTSNAKPLNIPPMPPYGHQEYLLAAVQGCVISSHLVRNIIETGKIVRVRQPRSYDATSLITKVLCRLVKPLKSYSTITTLRTHNVALKIALYWLINNEHLVKILPPKQLTLISLKNLGLAPYFPDSISYDTNDEVIHPLGVYLHFQNYPQNLEAIIEMLVRKINIDHIESEIKDLLPIEPILIPDDVIAVETLPIPGIADIVTQFPDMMNHTEGSVGALPEPGQWFETDAPAENATDATNVVYMGTIAAVIGTHAGKLLPEIGLVTTQTQPGYIKMVRVDIYALLQKILSQMVSKLMTAVPMSLEEGFYTLNAAFKSGKLTLNILQLGETPSKTMIPLVLKHYDILQFHPQLQHIKWELWPVPTNLQVLYLWVQPNLGVNLHAAIDARVQKLVNKVFPLVLQDLIEIMKHHLLDLSFYNLKEMPAKCKKIFKYDPTSVMSFLYDPESDDGVPAETFDLIDTPHTPISCPGHILSPTQPCTSHDCGYYACDSKNPWCYYPEGIECPGSISCPVVIRQNDQLLSCPEDEKCPITHMKCPGRSECPDVKTHCPGSPACPLSVKCPGTHCPNRFTSRPLILLPCPLHPLCSHPGSNQVTCTNDQSCDNAPKSASDVATAIKEVGQNIAETISKKETTINIKNTAVSNVHIEDSRNTAAANATTSSKLTNGSGQTIIYAKADAEASS